MIRSAAGAPRGDPLSLRATRWESTREIMLEIGIIVLSIVCFVVLDLYVLGCEKI
jgi:hypothetical protein